MYKDNPQKLTESTTRYPRGLNLTQNTYSSLLTHTKQLLLVTFCDTAVGIGGSFQTHTYTDTWADGQTGMYVEMFNCQ